MIPFLDLKAQYQQIKPEIDAAVMRVIDSATIRPGPRSRCFRGAFCCILRRQALHGAQQRNLGAAPGAACGRNWCRATR